MPGGLGIGHLAQPLAKLAEQFRSCVMFTVTVKMSLRYISYGSLIAPTGNAGVGVVGVKIAFTQLGIIIALTFIGLPFVIRSIQPVLSDLDAELEEAAASLGASRGQTFLRVIFPMLRPAILTGFALAFARALGETSAKVEVFSFGTRLTRLSKALLKGGFDRALQRVAAKVDYYLHLMR